MTTSPMHEPAPEAALTLRDPVVYCVAFTNIKWTKHFCDSGRPIAGLPTTRIDIEATELHLSKRNWIWGLVLARRLASRDRVGGCIRPFRLRPALLRSARLHRQDHTLVEADDGRFHLFYIKADESLPEGQRAKTLGHASSTDLVHWDLPSRRHPGGAEQLGRKLRLGAAHREVERPVFHVLHRRQPQHGAGHRSGRQPGPVSTG
jgi:hypothetical protein